MRGSPSKGRTPESLACDRGPRSSPTGSRPSRGRPHSRRPSAATLQPGPGRGLAGTWASPRPVPARPPRRSQLTRTRSPWHRRPHGRPAPDRGRQTSDTQAEVRPRLSDPQPAVPLAAPRAVRQPPPGQSALGPQAAPGAEPCRSRSPDSFSFGPIRIRLTRGSGGAPSQSPLGEGGFMQILELGGRGGRRKGSDLGRG